MRTRTSDPWWNLSVEEYLLDRVQKGQYILYLWQNQNTVVIGKNQNPWKECRTELLESEDGKLARRLSGGGAVFHDTGNLNFTFLMERSAYDLERQVSVILDAVRSLGIPAVKSGRNDITADERKFSGNAFCFRRSSAYHHGTLLVSADMNKLSRYLQVSAEKIKSKGVESVRSRVVNLSEYRPGLSIDELAEAVSASFKKIYGADSQYIDNIEFMDADVLNQLYKKYSSWEWRYGEAPKFDIDLSTRFPWGGVEFGLTLEAGTVTKAAVYSDAMDADFIEILPQNIEGCPFRSKVMADTIREIGKEHGYESIAGDIAGWLESKGF